MKAFSKAMTLKIKEKQAEGSKKVSLKGHLTN